MWAMTLFMQALLLSFSFSLFSCGLKRPPISKNKLPSVFEKYGIQESGALKKEDEAKKKDSQKK